MLHSSLSIRAHLVTWLFACCVFIQCIGCDKAERGENFRATGGSGGSGGSGQGGSGGQSMDSSVADADDDDSGDSGEGGTGGQSMDAGFDANVPTPTFTNMGLLMASGQCALGHYAEFESLATLQVNALETYADEPTTTHRDAARQAFVAAMAAWQHAEIFRFGPAARSTETAGQNLRDQIYFFPTINRCLIDQQIVNQRYAATNYATAQASSRGLSAIEYLLFYEGSTNACGPNLAINTNGTWALLTSEALTQRRADYALAAARNIQMHARSLVQAWEPSGGNFMAQWVAPGASSPFTTEHAALTALVSAAFYIDKEIKDSKLSNPLSIAVGGMTACANAPAACPELVESRFSRTSIDNIRNNLHAFRQVFQGCGAGFSGLGIEDWLRAIDHNDVADDMLAAIENAQTVAANVGSLEDAVAQSPPTQALQLHAAIKAITDLFKSEMLAALMVELPGGGGHELD